MSSNTLDLTRFGLQHTQDVDFFLKSPEGKAITSLINQEITKIDALEAAEHTHQQNRQLRRHRLILGLLMLLIEEKHAHAKKHDKEIQQELNHLLRLKQQKEKEDIESLRLYEEVIVVIKENIHRLETTLSQEQETLSSLLATSEQTDTKYDTLLSTLDDIHFDDPSSFNEQSLALKPKIDSYTKITSKLINEGKTQEAETFQERIYALRMKADLLKQLELAHKENRTLYNKRAEPVPSLKDAAFYVSKDLALTLNKGQYYLHPRTQLWANMTQQAKETAQLTYRQSTNDIMSIKLQLQQQRIEYQNRNQTQQTITQTKCQTLQQELKTHQIILQKAQDTRTLALQPIPQIPRPLPDPTQSKAVQLRQQQMKMGLGIAPSGVNPLDIQQLKVPQNTPSLNMRPTPFNMKPKLGR